MNGAMARGIVSALLAAGCCVVPPARAADCPQPLRIAFSDAPAEPFLRGQGERFTEPPGVLVDWVRAALRRLGCLEAATLQRWPARRIRALVAAGEIDLVAGAGEGGPVASLLALPTAGAGDGDLSLGHVEYALYTRRAASAPEAPASAAVLPPARVGVTAGSRQEAIARERGWPTEPAPTHESTLHKLLAGRTPMVLMHSPYIHERLRVDPALAAQIVRFGPAIERRRLYVGAQPAFARRHAGFVRQLWRELCRQSAAAHGDGACRRPAGAALGSNAGMTDDLPPLPALAPGRYRHYKGLDYEVLAVARHSETLEPVVVYRPLYNDSGWWVRPHAMFIETVRVDGVARPRFERVASS